MNSLLLNDTRVDHHHGCERVVSAIQELALRHGFPIKNSFPSHSVLCDTPHYLAALQDVQVVLINGEGTLHHDRPAGLELLKAAQQAKSMGKYVVLLNTGWEENTETYGKYLQCFDRIVARDKFSAQCIEAFGVECLTAPDMSLYLPAPDSSLVAGTSGSGIAYTDSVKQDITLALWKQSASASGRLVSIQFPFEPSLKARYRFVREAVGVKDIKNPSRLVQLLACRMDFLKVSDSSTETWLRALAQNKVLVSGRFHACTLAMLMNVPFVAIQSNTKKIARLIEDVGLNTSRLVDPKNLNQIESSACSYSREEQDSIASYIAEGRKQTDKIFAGIRAGLFQ